MLCIHKQNFLEFKFNNKIHGLIHNVSPLTYDLKHHGCSSQTSTTDSDATESLWNETAFSHKNPWTFERERRLWLQQWKCTETEDANLRKPETTGNLHSCPTTLHVLVQRAFYMRRHSKWSTVNTKTCYGRIMLCPITVSERWRWRSRSIRC